jgi:hypothetical protein
MCSGPIRGLTPRTAMLVGRLVLPCLGIVWFPGRHAGQWCGGRAGPGGWGEEQAGRG